MTLPPFVNKFIKDLVTVANGTDFDIGRVLWLITVIMFLGLAGWAVIHNHQILDFANFGLGAGAVLAGGGAGLGMKKGSEPQ